MDIGTLIKEVGEKPTIEDSVSILLIGIAHEILLHPGDAEKNAEVAQTLVTHINIIGAAVSDNISSGTPYPSYYEPPR